MAPGEQKSSGTNTFSPGTHGPQAFEEPVASCDMTKYMNIFLTMIKINIAEAKAGLSGYLTRVERGETIILCRRNVPIAEIRPIPAPPRTKRPIGIDRGMSVPDSFFEPLPDELLRAFGASGEEP